MPTSNTLSAASRLHREKPVGDRAAGGFSLIEVVLAIGVVAFSFVALLGLLPAGLANFRKAMDASVGAEIGQRVLNDLQESDFNVLLGQTSAGAGMTSALNEVLAQQSNGAQTTRLVSATGYLSHRFFDDQGNEVVLNPPGTYNPTDPTAAQRTASRILYDVHTAIILESQIPSMSGGSDGFIESPSLANVVVQVFSNPAGATLPDNLTATRVTSAQSIYMAGSTSVPYTTYTGFISQNSRPTTQLSSGS